MISFLSRFPLDDLLIWAQTQSTFLFLKHTFDEWSWDFFLDVITETADKKIQQWKIHLFKYVMTIQAFLKTKIDKINLMNHE